MRLTDVANMSPGETALSSVASGNSGNLTLNPLDNPLSSGFGWPCSEPHHCTPDTAILLWRKTHTFIFSVVPTHPSASTWRKLWPGLGQPNSGKAPHLPECTAGFQLLSLLSNTTSSQLPCVAGVPLLCAHCKGERCRQRGDCHSTPGRRYLQELISLECRRLKFSVVSAGFFSLPGNKDYQNTEWTKGTAPEMAYPNLRNCSVTTRTPLFSNKLKLHKLYLTQREKFGLMETLSWRHRNTLLCCSGVIFKRAQTETQAQGI